MMKAILIDREEFEKMYPDCEEGEVSPEELNAAIEIIECNICKYKLGHWYLTRKWGYVKVLQTRHSISSGEEICSVWNPEWGSFYLDARLMDIESEIEEGK